MHVGRVACLHELVLDRPAEDIKRVVQRRRVRGQIFPQ